MASERETSAGPPAGDGQGTRRTATRVIYALVALSAVLLAIDPLVHKHSKLAIEHVWGFYGLFGLGACVVIVLAARLLRLLASRPEDYYD